MTADRSADLLQQIFHLVVNRTSASARPERSSLAPIQAADRSVMGNIQVKSSTPPPPSFTFVAS